MAKYAYKITLDDSEKIMLKSCVGINDKTLPRKIG